jgi:Zn-dependent protease
MDPLSLIFYFVVIIPSSIIHEYAHGWVADKLGDPTARYAGRLTIDPRAHIDLWGTILLPVGLFFLTQGRFLFAYAKPVPYNPYNLKYRKWGPAMVGVAGPMANLLLAVSFALLLRFIPGSGIAPFLAIIIYANILLMVFNLVPIPPLDGSKVLFALLPHSLHHLKVTLERYGIVLMLFFVFFLFRIISPIIDWVYGLLVSGVTPL